MKYVNKMQVLVNIEVAKTLIDSFGADFFDKVNIRDARDIRQIVKNSIQYPHGEGNKALVYKLDEIRAEFYNSCGASIMVEFIKK